MALLGQKAENKWVGVNCGIMDQLISAAGVADKPSSSTALARDAAGAAASGNRGRRARHRHAAGLVDSAYNERRAQCEAAAKLFGVKALRDITSAQLAAARPSSTDDSPARPARRHRGRAHAAAAEAMRGDDAARLGTLMNESHESLRHDFEVCNDGLNVMVDEARRGPVLRGAHDRAGFAAAPWPRGRRQERGLRPAGGGRVPEGTGSIRRSTSAVPPTAPRSSLNITPAALGQGERTHANRRPGWVDYFVLALYVAFVIGIGWVLKAYMKTSSDFLTARGSIPAWVTGLAFMSANLGALELVGMAASGAKYGIATAHFYWVGAIPAMVFLAVFMMPFYYGRSALVPEYLKLRFDERTRALNSITFAAMTVFASGISMNALAKLLNQLLGWNYHMACGSARWWS